MHCRYEDYLDSKINKDDLFYLESIEVARRKIEFGCAGTLSLPEPPYNLHSAPQHFDRPLSGAYCPTVQTSIVMVRAKN